MIQSVFVSSVFQLCLTFCDPMDCGHQAPLFMGLSQQEYWSGLRFPPPGDFPHLGMEPGFLAQVLCHWATSEFWFSLCVCAKYISKTMPVLNLQIWMLGGGVQILGNGMGNKNTFGVHWPQSKNPKLQDMAYNYLSMASCFPPFPISSVSQNSLQIT